MKTNIHLICLIIMILSSSIYSQENKVYVDDDGILRWTADDSDVALFGVNYDVPFAHSYRSIKKLGLSHKDAIDMDVNQFARLELDAYRIHIWDREICDKEGNLDVNDHIELLDYLIYKLKEKNISILLTPIAWWGTGWPEPDPETKGFSSYYSKEELVTNDEARKAQKNYIGQILNHINKYTGLSYKSDPDIIAFEVINEPGHPHDIEMVTAYINEMVQVFRDEGVSKPVYYNISQNWSDEQAKAVYNADIDGISFQWYPTGLVNYSALRGNYLPHVDHYPIPEIDDPEFTNKSRMVYEFDAADVALPVMYPAMARSFREAGMQWATMFAYDASYLAAYNTDYNTHYVNLLYTPAKAISLMIAANVFKNADPYESFGSYPDNTNFEGCSIDYAGGISKFSDQKRFYYTGNTDMLPENIKSLKHIAGCGSSGLIKYNGYGSYFLDKISEGIWRLEVYPDAIQLKDPFGRNSLDRKVTDLLYNLSEFTIDLDDLTEDFYVYPVNNSQMQRAQNKKFKTMPGVYVLANTTVEDLKKLDYSFRKRGISDYPDMRRNAFKTFVRNNTPTLLYSGSDLDFNVEVFSDAEIDSVKLFAKRTGWRGFASSKLRKTGKYTYSGNPGRFNNNPGLIEYCYRIYSGAESFTYPGYTDKSPDQWDFEQKDLLELNIIPEENDIVIFDPAENTNDILLPPIWNTANLAFNLIEDRDNNPVVSFGLSDFRAPLDYFTFQIDVGNELKADNFKGFEIELPEIAGVDSVHFTIVDFNGNSKGTWIKREEGYSKVIIPLQNLASSDFTLLPRPYPHFLPLQFESVRNLMITINQISYLQLTLPVNTQINNEKHVLMQLGRIKVIK